VAYWQLNQTRGDAALDQRIDNHIDAKLQPITEGITKLREDVAYLKAKVEDATAGKVVGFSKLPTTEILDNLPVISKTINEARAKQLISPPEAVAELRSKLAQVQPRNPQFWPAVSNVISYQSMIAEKMGLLPNAGKVKKTSCHYISVGEGAHVSVDGFRFAGCSQQIDNFSLSNGTFENSIIIYEGGPLHLQNVTFKNCLFIVSFPVVPSPPAQKLGQALLATIGTLPNFTL
jgi:hypothetical protein